MSWPGSTPPAGIRRPRRRSKSVRLGTSATTRALTKIGREQGIIPKPRRLPEQGVCLDHAFESLGFTSAWDLALFIDSLAARGPRRKKRRLPAWKVPPHCLAATALRCKSCSGTGQGCTRCLGYGWGIVLTLRRARCGHAMAPALMTPAG